MIVEDEAALRMLLAAILRQDGFDVIESTAVSEAIALLGDNGAGFELVVTDFRMPGKMDGLSFARYVRQSFPAIPILLISGYVEDEAELDGLPFLQKPFALQKFLDCVHKVREQWTRRAIG